MDSAPRMNSDITEFTAVDRTADPGDFRRFLDEANAIPGLIACKDRLRDSLRLAPGARVLDVGCGVGTEAEELAKRVGSGGKATGVDISAAMIAEARSRAQSVSVPVAYEEADSQALPFQDETFDAVRAERLLMHVPDAKLALREMVRVTKRGGRIGILDFDWDMQAIDSSHKETTRTIARSFCDALKNGWIGRQLPRLMRQSGATDVSVSPQTIFVRYPFVELLLGGHIATMVKAGTLSSAETEAWWADLREARDAGTLLCGFTAFVVVGTRA